MTVGAFLIVGGILLLNAAIRDENVVDIIAGILSNKPLDPIKGSKPSDPSPSNPDDTGPTIGDSIPGGAINLIG